MAPPDSTRGPTPRGREFLGTAAVLSLLGATGLAALGRFRPAVALTLGASVAIVSALWLSDFLGRLAAPDRSSPARFDWKLGLKAVLRYGLIGVALWASVRAFPADVPWLVGGLSTVVAAAALEGILEHLRGRGRGTGSAP